MGAYADRVRTVGQSIAVVTAVSVEPWFPCGRPMSFTREAEGLQRTYRVSEVLDSWVRQRDWWADDLPLDASPDIWSYRVNAVSAYGHGALVLQVIAASGAWTLAGFED